MGKKKKKNTWSKTMSKKSSSMEVTQESEVGLQWFDADNSSSAQSELALLLPESPDKLPPLKRGRQEVKAEGSSVQKVVPKDTNKILTALKTLSDKIDHTFTKVAAIEKTSEITSSKLTELASTVQNLVLNVGEHGVKINSMEREIARLKDENSTSITKVADSQHYTRRWSLKLHGLKEDDHEDIRACTIDALHKVAPHAQFNLEEVVDIIHCVGRKAPNGKFP